MPSHILESTLLLLMSAVVVSTLFRKLNLPSVLGYIVVGTLVGPYGLGLIPDKQATSELASFGVVFLMFTIGLEFSLPKLISMKRAVLGLGGLQVIITTGITLLVAAIADLNLAMAFVVGGVVAMSSTAIVSKQLKDQVELNTLHGNNAIGILLFQDIAVIPFLILIPSLASGGHNVFIPLLHAILKTLIVMIVIILLGRKVLRPIFRAIAGTHSLEIFTLTVLLVTLTAAWLTDRIGLSAALGAFLAGMMLGETEFRHQIEAEIRPFRDVLLGLFFITIGMLLNLEIIPETLQGILILLTILIIFKTVVIFSLCRLMGNDSSTALRTGLVLAQGGEFSFALLTIAMNEELFPLHYNQMLLCALLLSMALSPFIVRYNKTISTWFLPKKMRMREDDIVKNVAQSAHGLQNHVLIAGYGRVGQNICQFLEKENFEFLALDLDPSLVQKAQLAGERVSYGDASNMSILLAAGLEQAKALIFSIEDPLIAIKTIQQVRQFYANLPILVRTRDDTHLTALQEAGATEVIPETLEASLMIAFHVLILMDVPIFRAVHHLRTTRNNRYQLLNRIYPNEQYDEQNENIEDHAKPQLHVVKIYPEAYAVGHQLKDFSLNKTSVIITAIKRKGQRISEPGPETRIRKEDVLVLYGLPEQVETVENLLLHGI